MTGAGSDTPRWGFIGGGGDADPRMLRAGTASSEMITASDPLESARGAGGRVGACGSGRTSRSRRRSDVLGAGGLPVSMQVLERLRTPLPLSTW